MALFWYKISKKLGDFYQIYGVGVGKSDILNLFREIEVITW